MFTGIVSDVGEVRAVTPRSGDLHRVEIACGYPHSSIALGASISCSGICLTVTDAKPDGAGSVFSVDAAAETLRPADLAAFFAFVFILLTVDRFALRAMCISKNHIEVKSDGTTRANGTWFHRRIALNLSHLQSDQCLMDIVRALTALMVTLAVLGAGFWIGKRWIPPYETEVVDKLVVEKICRAWTDGCVVYGRDRPIVSQHSSRSTCTIWRRTI